ncbi:MAG: hypothetical protein RR306_03085 [Clostridia bacterium]
MSFIFIFFILILTSILTVAVCFFALKFFYKSNIPLANSYYINAKTSEDTIEHTIRSLEYRHQKTTQNPLIYINVGTNKEVFDICHHLNKTYQNLCIIKP